MRHEGPLKDPLTGLFSRRALERGMENLSREAERGGSPFTVMLLDLDHFKEVNDTYGHEVGDAVIAAWGAFLRSSFRPGDWLIRYGGDEFVILLPHTSRKTALKLAHRLLEEASRREFAGFSVGASVGLASFPTDAMDPFELLALADRALYAAKHRGRGRVETPEREKPDFVWPPPYVSRIREERDLLDALRESPPLILVRGPAGSGKSALVNRVIQQDTRKWVRVSAYPQSAPLQPFKLDEGTTPGEALALLQSIPDRALVVENIQWLDGASWQVLSLLLMQDFRVVATIRDEELDRVVGTHLHQAYRMGWVREVQVGPLGPAQMEFLLRGALQATPPENLLQDIQHLSGGLPLLVGEILRELHRSGWLVVRRTWRYAGYLPDFRPPGLVPVWHYRIRDLSGEALTLLGLLGLGGGELPRETMEQVLPHAFLEGLDELFSGGWILENGGKIRIQQGIWGMFACHELDAETQRRFARELLARVGVEMDDVRRVWLEGLACENHAWAVLNEALENALRRSDAHTIRMLLFLGERLGVPPPDAVLRMKEARAITLRQTGDPELETFLEEHRRESPRIARVYLDHRIAYGDYRRALEEAESFKAHFSDPEARWGFELEQIWALINMGEMEEAYTRLLPLLRQIPRDHPDRARALNFLGQIRRFLSSVRGAHRAFKEALAIYRKLGDRRGEAAILTNWSLVFIDQDRFGEAEEYLKQALALYEVMDYPEGRVAALGNLAMVYADLGYAEQGIALLQEALDLAEHLGFRRPLPFFYRLMSIFHRHLGDLDRAMGYARRSLEEARRQGIVRNELQALLLIARIHAARGDRERTRKTLESGRHLANRKGVSLRDTFWWTYENLEFALAQRDWPRLREFFPQVREIAEELNPSYRLYAYLAGARLASVEGDRERAYAWLEKARRIASRLGSPMLNGVYALHRGEVELELGEVARSLSYLRRAQEIFRNLELNLWANQVEETIREAVSLLR